VKRHSTRTAYNPIEGRHVEVDALLAPLVRLLWRRNVETLGCCREHAPGLASIEFPGTLEVEEFLEVAQEDYQVEVEKWDEGEGGRHGFCVRLLVLFPTADVPKLVARFEAAPEGWET